MDGWAKVGGKSGVGGCHWSAVGICWLGVRWVRFTNPITYTYIYVLNLQTLANLCQWLQIKYFWGYLLFIITIVYICNHKQQKTKQHESVHFNFKGCFFQLFRRRLNLHMHKRNNRRFFLSR